MDTGGYIRVEPHGGFIAPVAAGRGEREGRATRNELGASGGSRRTDAAAATGRGSGHQGPQQKTTASRTTPRDMEAAAGPARRIT